MTFNQIACHVRYILFRVDGDGIVEEKTEANWKVSIKRSDTLLLDPLVDVGVLIDNVGS